MEVLERRVIMRDILLLHAKKYPAMKAEDGVKLCYQSEFGGGHLLPSREACVESIREERASAALLRPGSPLLEPVGGGLIRLHLNAEDAKNLRSETVTGLFMAVSEKARGTQNGFLEKVSVLRELTGAGLMPFSPGELDGFWKGYQQAGYPLCRHSEDYRQAYHPAYRLAGAETEKFLPLLMALDRQLMKKKTVTIAIDGPSGSGKSSLAAWLQKVYGDCAVFHMDDFFLPPERKTVERLNTPGGNVDWERFLEEVLLPLKREEPFSYRPYDCGTGMLSNSAFATPRILNIVEGVYSHHPALRDAYDMTIFLNIGRQEQSERILKRNGKRMHKRFLEEWIPLEDLYFREMCIAQKANFTLMV
jgi:uridine kinase